MHGTAKVSCWDDRRHMEEILIFNLKWKTLLVLDNATTHNTNKVKEKIKECETYASMIPSGLTWKLHPLDIIINRVFKENLRNKYVSYCIENNNLKVAKSTIIELVDEIWYSDSIIANEMIFNSFKFSGISSSLDGSEDDQFRGYEHLEKGNKIVELENDEALDQNDDYVTSNESHK